MTGLPLVAVIIQIISAVIVMVLVLLQKLKEGDGITSNNTNTNNSGMGMSKEKRLSNLTVVFGIIFIITTIITSTLLVRG